MNSWTCGCVEETDNEFIEPVHDGKGGLVRYVKKVQPPDVEVCPVCGMHRPS